MFHSPSSVSYITRRRPARRALLYKILSSSYNIYKSRN